MLPGRIALALAVAGFAAAAWVFYLSASRAGKVDKIIDSKEKSNQLVKTRLNRIKSIKDVED